MYPFSDKSEQRVRPFVSRFKNEPCGSAVTLTGKGVCPSKVFVFPTGQIAPADRTPLGRDSPQGRALRPGIPLPDYANLLQDILKRMTKLEGFIYVLF